MTTVTANKIRAFVLRMHENSLQIQEANKPATHYCAGWRGATNTYAIELLALLDSEAAAQAAEAERARKLRSMSPQELDSFLDEAKARITEAVEINVKLQNVAAIEHVGGDVAAVSVNGKEWPKCIDCGQPCSPERDPLRCLVCQLDADASKPEPVTEART